MLRRVNRLHGLTVRSADEPSGCNDVNLPSALIRAAPAYDLTWLNRTFEQGLYRHYQRSAYWDTEGMFS